MFRYLACYLAVSGLAVWGQESFVVAGRVVDSVSGAGVGRAQVTLSSWNEKGQMRRETFTDAGGGFRFDGLAVAQFSLAASKPRFERATQGVAVGPSKENVELRLSPLGVISGHVLDGAGRPMQGVQIRAYTSSVQDGRVRIRQDRSAATDDQGYYRFWNLRPGKFYLKAVGRAGGTALFTADRLPTYNSRESFVPVYAGGANRLENATPLMLGWGQEATADFRLPMEPAYRIRGVVAGLTPYDSAKFELLSGTEDVSANRAFLSAVNGAFEVQDVVPGAYRLRVTQGDREKRVVAETQVTVGGGDVGPLALQAFGTVDVAVREEVTGEEKAAPVNSMGLRRARSYCMPRLEEPGIGGQGVWADLGSANGSVALRRVLPGTYTVLVQCTGAYLTGLTAGGVDLMATGKLTLAAGAPAPELVVRADRNMGRVEIEAGPKGQVLIVPAGAGPEPARLVNAFMGKFPFDLGPGEYTFYLLKDANFPYREAEAVGRLRNGVKARVEAGQTVTVKLKEMAE